MKKLFLVGTPMSALQWLGAALDASPHVTLLDRPHVITPLAYLGYFGNVDKAPYDHVLAAEAQCAFVQALPHDEADYVAACRAYTDAMYDGLAHDTTCVVDIIPTLNNLIPVVRQLYPDALYLVVSGNPLELGAPDHINALAELLAEPAIDTMCISPAKLHDDPESTLDAVFGRLGIPPVHIEQPSKPFLAAFPQNTAPLKRLDPAVLASMGYTWQQAWNEVMDASNVDRVPRPSGLYRRGVLRFLRCVAKPFRPILKKMNLMCQVFLRA